VRLERCRHDNRVDSRSRSASWLMTRRCAIRARVVIEETRCLRGEIVGGSSQAAAGSGRRTGSAVGSATRMRQPRREFRAGELLVGMGKAEAGQDAAARAGAAWGPDVGEERVDFRDCGADRFRGSEEEKQGGALAGDVRADERCRSGANAPARSLMGEPADGGAAGAREDSGRFHRGFLSPAMDEDMRGFSRCRAATRPTGRPEVGPCLLARRSTAKPRAAKHRRSPARGLGMTASAGLCATSSQNRGKAGDRCSTSLRPPPVASGGPVRTSMGRPSGKPTADGRGESSVRCCGCEMAVRRTRAGEAFFKGAGARAACAATAGPAPAVEATRSLHQGVDITHPMSPILDIHGSPASDMHR